MSSATEGSLSFISVALGGPRETLADGEILKLFDEDTDLDNAMRLIQRKVQNFIDK